MINKAVTLAFVMCGIPFRVISNPFFVNALKALNPSYNTPSREVLSGQLLDNEVAKVNDQVDKIIEFINNITIEYLYELRNYSDQSHTAKFLSNEIELVINRIGSKKISAIIISDNGANIALARRIICSKYKNIMNIRCIAHSYNLISKDIIQHTFAERMIQRAELWQKMGMVNGMLNPYIAPYTIAIKLFSITPSSAACERIFSSLGWLYGKRRTQLGMNRLEGLAKIYQFNLSNAAEQLHKTEITCEMIKNIAETLDLNLNVSDIVDLWSPIFHPNHGIHPNVDNNGEDESSENELSEEDYEYDVNEIVVSRSESMQL
ncbi:hypothetical protein RclHR1_10050006 [Rhizophagus clarus]|uniref:DUF659 domain-containing protein n=1 Tax=Rhizophagus clarus TaxID=94130 RepID=A0A2Z6Q0M4_9GLOM|nr:hypothetical protein RclHR1_10050006 [Rhizophagus clarus]